MRISRKLTLALVLLMAHIILFNVILTSCTSDRTKYYKELNAAYYYDSDTSTLRKYPSEYYTGENELLSFDGKNTKAIKYETAEIVIPAKYYKDGDGYDRAFKYGITINYAVYNGSLVIAEVPEMQHNYSYFTIANSTDLLIVTVDNFEAYLVNLNDLSATALYEIISPRLDVRYSLDYVPAQTISVSPDGKYVLFLSNNDFFTNEDYTPASNADSQDAYDLYVYDITAKNSEKLIEFHNREFLGWKKESNAFLYREGGIDKHTGEHIYSNIFECSVNGSTNTFFTVGEEMQNYEMIDEEYLYSYHNIKGTGYLEVLNIYTQEQKSVTLPNYTHIWNLTLSETHEYIAFFGLHVDANWNQVSYIGTIHLETNDVVTYYELQVDEYFINSIHWGSDNTLIVNFVNSVNLYRDLCRFFKVSHKK